MSEYQNLTVKQMGAVYRISINRPDKLNALNQATLAELGHAFDQAASDADTRVIILTGSGDRAFVAGADISEIQSQTPVQAQYFSSQGQQLMLKIQHLTKPVIAAINGFALGGGLELAMACHLRIAADTAKLGLPEIKLGIMPGFGGTQRMARLIGRGAALNLILSGDPIGAERAYALGLITRLAAADELETSALEWAQKLAECAPVAVQGILQAINQGADLPLEAGLALETNLFALCCATEDMKEGTTAFLEKRPARFSGR
ncbi:MAG: enoyl-CoA hydratase-related protein [Wenzhouxiangellaceae bacterium]